MSIKDLLMIGVLLVSMYWLMAFGLAKIAGL